MSWALAWESWPRSASISSAWATSAGDVTTFESTPTPTALSTSERQSTAPALSQSPFRLGSTSTKAQASWS